MSRQDGNVQVPLGTGFWNSAKPAQYSKETQNLLKVMMQESRLTNFQQRQIKERLQTGDTLPVLCHPSSSIAQHKPRASESMPKKKNIANARSVLRPAEKCQAGDAYSREKFQPRPTRDLNKEKMRLQNIMATGKDLPDIPQALPQTVETETEERDRFDELVAEMQERWDFLKEMEALGRGRQYYNIINTEISQMLREMEMIDKQRSAALREAMQKAKDKDSALSQ
ncbi:PREDICTED: UPF0193 protein EVG1 [Nanorana parkeri]|uniref:UPF0193 protein EVG1 n=1 Tax=Nanorana parkeri TaxID=125878 RepID=UPI000854E160|nr:PREDICTED: UPF0193 protein EVG1 [Nanorana parkeri]